MPKKEESRTYTDLTMNQQEAMVDWLKAIGPLQQGAGGQLMPDRTKLYHAPTLLTSFGKLFLPATLHRSKFASL